MLIEIWSDVVCPFCYIGKRKLEKALADFPQISNPEIVWKSYQLMPDLKPEDYGSDLKEYLSRKYNVTLEEAKAMNDRVTEHASVYGLTYRLENSIVVNTLDAHRLSHLSKKYGKQHETEEALFKAYFTDGVNTADHDQLIKIGSSVGLPTDEIKAMLSTDEFSAQVEEDIYESRQLGIRGVPFFVFNRKYAISGAQEDLLFSQTIEKILAENN
jgi:predicted DsbA family dithiol-disulfide isomerase